MLKFAIFYNFPNKILNKKKYFLMPNFKAIG